MDPHESQNLLEFKKIKYDDGSESVHFAAFYKGVPNEFKNFAEEKLGETPEMVSRGIKYLNKFLEDKGLPQADEKHLLVILRNCKHDLKKSKVKLEKFLRAKQLVSEKLAEVDEYKLDQAVRHMNFAILPYRDKQGRLICTARTPLNMERFCVNEESVCAVGMTLYFLEFPMTSLFGITFIADFKGTSFVKHYQIVKAIKSWIGTLFDLPLPVRKLHILNENILVRWIMNLARPFAPAKFFRRITLHGDHLESLKKMIHPDLLPEEFGGNMGPLNCKHYREEILDFMRKLKEEHLAKMAAKS